MSTMSGSRDPQQQQRKERTTTGSRRWLFFVERLFGGQKRTIVIWTVLAATILWNIIHNARVLDVSKMIPTVGTTVSFSSSENHHRHRHSNPTNSTQTTIITHHHHQRRRRRHVSSDGISSSTEEPKTLAMLYPVSLLGGYRNQAMRFFSFVQFALRNDYTQLLLPTLVWSTRYLQYHLNDTTNTTITSNSREQELFWPVPMEDLFDIDHWNSYHQPYNNSNNTNNSHQQQQSAANVLLSLPKLVDTISNSDCWNTTTPSLSEQKDIIQQLRDNTNSVKLPKLTLTTVPTLLRQTSPLRSATIQYVTGNISKVRRISGLMQQVQHCQHPAIHGGGVGVGTLWKDYETKIAAQQHRPEIQHFLNTVNQALRPASQWRSLADHCLDYHLSPPSDQHDSNNNSNNNKTNTNQHQRSIGYAVLHARVESDMAGHKCGKHMERNLTKLFDWMDALVQEYNTNVTIRDNDHNGHHHHHRYPTLLRGTMVAIARGYMNPNHNNNNNNDRFAVENWYTLNDRSVSYSNQSYQFDSHKSAQETTTITTNRPVVFECGEGWLQEAFYNNPLRNPNQLPNGYYGNILPAILDFWLAVQADVFVGVMHSSWSTDVWTTRYHQGKGRHNYQYTTADGIIPLPNRDGLPPAHTRC
ncbi:GDP-fucose protein O-fucosyltransferase [Nitzschia inconspicua]|uniref:GDP-fucose protein O-fucosyltransferase n=1 Tax=Nitzschia inconspicua TaxID=303405 RepID=A0A9K3Q996_9STRA|nr:GDP-fucose protein O-fucosyltransferase [Nitzschia inconspicua]KAG7375025.1 GDP-fucose protein O-fucosyltransferase [Nitzschia inconspicua]